MKKYNGVYAPYIVQFINFKRSLGYKFISEEYEYLMFDRFTVKEGATLVGITKSLSDKWSEKRLNESDSTRYIRIELIAQFSAFLCEMGHPSYIPKLPRKKSTYTPYIFSKDELKSFFCSCDRVQMKCKQFDTSISTIPALFRLLYGTGVRLSEALFLQNRDINLENNYFIIKGCKNGKDRIIPFSDTLSDVCRQYYEYRNLHLGKCSGDDYFFITHTGSICPRKTIYNWFRRVLFDAGISHLGKGHGPRIHDFRHTFSVHALVTMAEAGLDLYYSLPILSTYLGHQSLEATDQYVRLTSEMYPNLLRDINGICDYIFPKIKCHETY
jgi:integrase